MQHLWTGTDLLQRRRWNTIWHRILEQRCRILDQRKDYFCTLGADSFHSGNVVRGVSHQRLVCDDLLWFDSLLGEQLFRSIDCTARYIEKLDSVGENLLEVLVLCQ